MDFVAQLAAQFGIVSGGAVLVAWVTLKFLGKRSLDHQFKKWEEEHSQELQHQYKQEQESFKQWLESQFKEKHEAFKQALENDYKEKHESFRQALANVYNKELEELKARRAKENTLLGGLIMLDLEQIRILAKQQEQAANAEAALMADQFRLGQDFHSKKQLANSEKRLDAYRSLWSLMAPLSPQVGANLDRKVLVEAFRKWYYEFGNGLLLTWRAQNAYLVANELLSKEEATEVEVRKAFSTLRTQMKVDIDVYTDEESKKRAG
jgi:hypothetical protein